MSSSTDSNNGSSDPGASPEPVKPPEQGRGATPLAVGSPAAPAAPAAASARPATPAATSAGASAPAAPAPAKPSAPAAPPPPPPPPAPNPLAHMAIPMQGVHYDLRGVHAEATVEPSQVVFSAEQMDKEGFALDTITGVDWLAQSQMEIVYDYFHPAKNLRAAVRTRVPRDNAELPTISNVFPGANWHERETHDFFGIRFTGHPDLSPFLLPEDATYHPLKKDFVA